MQILTNSSMGCYVACPRRYEYRYERGLRRAQESDALRIGSMVHDGLDHLAKGSALDAVFELILANYENLLKRAGDDDHATRLLVEAETCFRLIQGYSEHYVDSKVEIMDSEVSFQVSIRNPDTGNERGASRIFERAGKIDKIVRYRGQLFIMEHKTTSQDINPNSEYWQHLRLDPQISGYMLGAWAKYFDVDGVLYDAIRKPAIRPKKITKADIKTWMETGKYCGEEFDFDATVGSETPRMFGARLIQTIRGDPERYFQRQEIARLTSDLVEYKQDVWSLQKQIRDSQRHGRWYRNSRACLQPYRCEFTDLCFGGISPESVAESIPSGYEILENVHPELKRGKHGKATNGATNDRGAETEAANSATEASGGGFWEW